MVMPMPDDLDLVHGVRDIATKALKTTERRTRHLLETGRVPGAFKLDWKWSLRLSTFCAGIEQLEKDGRIAERDAGKAAA
jgi:hypothetical protein